ncbi:MAG: phosphoribosyl-ATP diphosphatase [Gammaproteobacteria bacterium TMED78]|nr:MAG: phosphoribosyl-ATP diphosphatase [Gammaproteobacteria bacterium TMED78]|tara:strand:- start:16245 stop:16532 length:288 start_codon:yes stop_codon:yes gene_type:complete
MSNLNFLNTLENVINDRITNNNENSYTASLIKKGELEICKKIGEEATEIIIAATKEDSSRVIYESADLIYHLLVLLNLKEIKLEEVVSELEKRNK